MAQQANKHRLYLSIEELLGVNTVTAQDRGRARQAPVSAAQWERCSVSQLQCLFRSTSSPKASSTQSLPLVSFQGGSRSYISAPTA